MVAKYPDVVGVWTFLSNLLNPLFGLKRLVEMRLWIIAIDEHGLVSILEYSMPREDMEHQYSLATALLQLFTEFTICLRAHFLCGVPNIDYVFISDVVRSLQHGPCVIAVVLCMF